MTTERDIRNQIAYARDEGIAQGRAEIARAMLAEKMDPALIAKCTGHSIEEIEALKKN